MPVRVRTHSGVGPIRFPVSAASARKLCKVARPAAHGRGTRTLTDPKVRDTWEIPKLVRPSVVSQLADHRADHRRERPEAEEASLLAAAGQETSQPANADVVCQCVVLVAWIDDRDAIECQEFASTAE